MELLEEAIEKLGSVAAVARYLHIKPPYLFRVRAGTVPLAPYHEARLAELLEKNPAQAYVQAQIRAAGKKEEAASLKRWFRSVAASIAAVFVVAGVSGLWSQTSTACDSRRSESRELAHLPTDIQCVHLSDGRYLRWGLFCVGSAIKRALKALAEKTRDALFGVHTSGPYSRMV